MPTVNAIFFGGPKDKQLIEAETCPSIVCWHGIAWAIDLEAHTQWIDLGHECRGAYYAALGFQQDILYIWNAVE